MTPLGRSQTVQGGDGKALQMMLLGQGMGTAYRPVAS